MKKYLSLLLFLLVLFTISGFTSAATVDVKGNLQVIFNLNQFDLDQLALKWNANLSPNNGIEGEFRFRDSSWDSDSDILPIESVYFFQKHLFQNTDVMQVGYFPITWASGKSVAIRESLADNYDPNNGAGIKYSINLNKLSLTSSLSNTLPADDTGAHLDLAARLDFPVLRDLNIGVGLSSVSSTVPDTKSVVIDAIYNPKGFQVLGELVTRSNAGADWESGLYMEGAFNISNYFQAYAGICSATNLDNEWILVGGKYNLTENMAIQGEYQSYPNNNQIIFRFRVGF